MIEIFGFGHGVAWYPANKYEGSNMTKYKCHHFKEGSNDISGWCHLFARSTKCKGKPEMCDCKRK